MRIFPRGFFGSFLDDITIHYGSFKALTLTTWRPVRDSDYPGQPITGAILTQQR